MNRSKRLKIVSAKNVPVLGKLFQPFEALGYGFLVVAAIPLIPYIAHSVINRNERIFKGIENDLKGWIRNIKVGDLLEYQLNTENSRLWEIKKAELSPVIDALENSLNKIREIRANVEAQSICLRNSFGDLEDQQD